MQINPFSCVRPDPERVGEALSQGIFSDDAVRRALKAKILTLDISRAFYLVAYSDGTRTFKSLIACIETEPTASAATADAQEQPRAYQTEPTRVVYATNAAIEIILSAATAAVPLYNMSNGARQIVVWRISRAEAVEALQAAFESVELIAPETPYARTMVELLDTQSVLMPALPTGLFAHSAH